MSFEGCAPEDLARAVRVAYRQSEEDAHRQPVGSRIGEPDERVSPPEPVADDDVWLIGCLQTIDQQSEIGDAELAVAVEKCDQVVAGSAEATAQRGTIAAVHLMVNSVDLRVFTGQAIGDRRCCVTAAVIDGDDLEPFSKRGQHAECLIHEGDDVLGLIMGGKEEGELGDARPVGG